LRRRRLTRALLGLGIAALLTTGSPAGAAIPHEPFFPRSGNRGYDVSHYGVRLAYRPHSGFLKATARIKANATANLSRLSLDLDGLQVARVAVDDVPARFSRGREKLRIVPRQTIPRGEEFTAVVHYRGRPRPVVDPDGSREGWNRTPDGAIAVGEPVGTASWLPCDNVPTDKASWDFAIKVPERLTAVANGRLVQVTRANGTRTFRWSERQPMVPYLAVVDVGRGRLEHSRIAGLPAWTLVDPKAVARARPVLRKLPEVIRFESKLFGPYPFDAAGSIVDPIDLEYALETQTRPIYASAPDLPTLVHETAHQWFGDSVGLERWPEIWLNEGFATWVEWFYAERHGGRTVRQVFDRLYAIPISNTGFWEPPSGHPGQAKNLFTTSTYLRGGMALEALRIEVGTKTMLKILRRWATEHRYGNADIAQFQALAEEVSGQRLGGLLHRWLFRRGKPGLPGGG
jgi:aminopeptidase N